MTTAGAGRAQHDTLELLGICERTIHARRVDGPRLRRRIRTTLVEAPRTLGQHIHRRRVDAGLRQWELAAQWGVCRSMIGAWEADHYQPQGEMRAKVAAFVGFKLGNVKEKNSTAG